MDALQTNTVLTSLDLSGMGAHFLFRPLHVADPRSCADMPISNMDAISDMLRHNTALRELYLNGAASQWPPVYCGG
jgi:hypothetical protein